MRRLGGSDGSRETFELDRGGEFYNERFAGFRSDLHLWRTSGITLTLGQSNNFLALMFGKVWPVGSDPIGKLSSRLLLLLAWLPFLVKISPPVMIACTLARPPSVRFGLPSIECRWFVMPFSSVPPFSDRG